MVRRLRCQFQTWKACCEASDGDLDLLAREWGADAEVDTTAETNMSGVAACDVEPIRVVEPTRIALCGAEQQT